MLLKASPHTLYGLGVGPGDPELITVKALKILQAAPVVAFPAGKSGNPGVAERIIQPWLSPDQTRLPLAFPYVLDEQTLATAWQKAAARVLPHLQTGNVAFACEGDVSFYGTFTYLAQYVQKLDTKVAIRAIAGISSPMAAAAAARIPLTCQSDKLAILPALYSFNQSFNQSPSTSELSASEPSASEPSASDQTNPSHKSNQLEAALEWAEVIVLMKVGSVYSQVWQTLQRHHLLEKSIVVSNATRPEENIWIGLQDHPNLQLPYFSLLIVQPAKRTLM